MTGTLRPVDLNPQRPSPDVKRAQVRVVLGRVMAQRRSVEVAFGYAAALSPDRRANCWALAEAAGHEGWHRMQALLGTYRWEWRDLRAELPALAAAWLPDGQDDLIGPGIAIDETAQLKNGDATACVAPQHAWCTGKVENCVTTVFSAYVTAGGQAWADFDVYMPQRWASEGSLVRSQLRPPGKTVHLYRWERRLATSFGSWISPACSRNGASHSLRAGRGERGSAPQAWSMRARAATAACHRCVWRVSISSIISSSMWV